MRIAQIVLACALLLVSPLLFAQAPAELPGYSVSTFVGYSSVSGTTASGMFLSLAAPLKTVYLNSTLGTMTVSARADNFWNTTPGVNVILGGPEQRFQFSKATFLNGLVFQPFVNEMAGIARNACVSTTSCAAGVTTASHFAYKVGGGLDLVLTSNMTARLFEVDYIRSSLLPNGHLTVSNAAQITAGIGFHF